MSDDPQDSQAEDADSAERAFALQNAAFLLQLFTLATAFVLGLGIKHLKIHWIHEAGATILLGVLVGLMISGSSVSDEITDWLDFDESVFFFLLLPPIIFEGGYSLRSREFFANFGAICSLAFAGTTISTFAVGFFVWICGGVGLCYGLPLLHALVFGALISATDSFLELRLKHAPLRPFHARHCGPRVAETKGRSALNKLERENVPQALSTRNQKAVPCMREQSDWICISQIDVSASPPSITGSC